MMTRLLSLALIAAVFACPLVCGLAPAVRAQGEAAASCYGCCQRCEMPAPADETSAPTGDHSPDGESCCQCICNGAVVEHAALPSFGVDLDCWAPVPAAISLAANAAQGRLGLLQAANQPDDGANPGRATRCLFMSFLC